MMAFPGHAGRPWPLARWRSLAGIGEMVLPMTVDRTDEWAELRERYVVPHERGAPTTARGVHHTAHISSDVSRTIDFYQGLLGFPLTELFENRLPGSTHFFFDIGNGNALAFFDFPGLDVGPYQEVLGGHHRLAISVRRSSGRSCGDASTRRASSTTTRAGCRCTSGDPTASASS